MNTSIRSQSNTTALQSTSSMSSHQTRSFGSNKRMITKELNDAAAAANAEASAEPERVINTQQFSELITRYSESSEKMCRYFYIQSIKNCQTQLKKIVMLKTIHQWKLFTMYSDYIIIS